MTVSSYQAQQVLGELRRRLQLEQIASPPEAGVRRSTITIIEDDEEAPASRAVPSVTGRTVVDAASLPPLVTRELERRAGAFMQPPVAPREAAAPIPKTGVRPLPPTPRRDLGEAD